MNQEQRPHQQPVQYVYYAPEPPPRGAANTLAALILGLFGLAWFFTVAGIGFLVAGTLALGAAESVGTFGGVMVGFAGIALTALVAAGPPAAILRNI